MAKVAILRSESKQYGAEPPFHPPASFPELDRAGIREIDASNGVYGAVRDMFALLRLDEQNFETPEWNPLGAYIRRGDRVIIKPNFVLHEFGVQKGASCLTTHGSVLRAVLDYAYLATGPDGRIIIADAPLQGADFERLVSDAGVRRVQEFYRQNVGYAVDVIDLRQVHAVIDEASSLIRRVERLAGDPRGYCEVELGHDSRLNEVDGSRPRYVVGDYDTAVTNARHCNPRHSYVVSRTVLDADTVICVPKLKTHSKAGVTVCLKNMVGIIGSKDSLPHHRYGKVNQGGDEFPSDYPTRWLVSTRAHDIFQGHVSLGLWRLMRRFAGALLGAGTPANGNGQRSNFFPSGGWHGNDTIWRTVDDLNRILFFYDPAKGNIQPKPQRRYFAVVDGIVAMEGNGPLRGTPRPAGVIIGGDDPLALDVVAATLMGFDWRRIRMLKGITDSKNETKYSAFAGEESSLQVISNASKWSSLEDLRQERLDFHAPSGWREFVEMQHVE
jgi:uncharacterized protein (DUF362 family)